MTSLTHEQKAAYIADPTKCPFCGQKTSQIGSCGLWGYGVPCGGYEDNCGCVHCGAKWKEHYTLTDITVTREPEEKV